MFGPPQKPWLWTEKPKSTSSAIIGVETAAKCCELKRCADRVRNRTDKTNLNFSHELYSLIFSPSTKKTTEYSFELFFPLTKLFLTFVVFACFADPVVRTDGRSRDYNVTTKISWLDRLPNLLSNGAPLAR